MARKIERYTNRRGGVVRYVDLDDTARPSECSAAFKALRDNAGRLRDNRAGLEYIEIADGHLRVVLEQGPR